MARDTAAIGENVVIGENTPPVETTVEALIRAYNRLPLNTNLTSGDRMEWNGTAWVPVGKDTSFGVPMTPSPSHQNGSGAWDAANRAWYYRSEHGGTISKLTIYVATASGNISLAVYANAGSGQSAAPTGGQTVTTGAIACPAAGRAVVSLGASHSVPAGDWLGMSCDNITAAFYRYEAAGIVELVHGLGGFQGTAHPLPATPAVSWRHGRIWTIAGVA